MQRGWHYPFYHLSHFRIMASLLPLPVANNEYICNVNGMQRQLRGNRNENNANHFPSPIRAVVAHICLRLSASFCAPHKKWARKAAFPATPTRTPRRTLLRQKNVVGSVFKVDGGASVIT